MSINSLVPGGVYRVTRRFTDCHGATFEPGSTFTYHSRSYWAYDDGIMLNCAGMRIDFREGHDDDLISGFADYVEKIGQTDPPPQIAPDTQAPFTWWELIGIAILVSGSILVIAVEPPNLTGGYMAAWVTLAVAVCWGAVVAARWRRSR